MTGHQQLRIVSLPSNHKIKSLLEHYYSNALNPHCFSLEKLTFKQRLKVKDSIINTNSCLNEILSSFNSLYEKLIPSFWLVDIFYNYFLFNIAESKINDYKTVYLQKLNNISKDSLYDIKTVIFISNASIKNNIAMFIAYVYSDQNIVAKTIHHTVNIKSTKTKLFVIRYRIN